MAERQLPKLKTRVRFPSPAPVESLDARYAFGAFSITEMQRSRLSRHLFVTDRQSSFISRAGFRFARISVLAPKRHHFCSL